MIEYVTALSQGKTPERTRTLARVSSGISGADPKVLAQDFPRMAIIKLYNLLHTQINTLPPQSLSEASSALEFLTKFIDSHYADDPLRQISNTDKMISTFVPEMAPLATSGGSNAKPSSGENHADSGDGNGKTEPNTEPKAKPSTESEVEPKAENESKAEENSNVNDNMSSQFADAIDNEDIESMHSMIEAGFDVNTVDSDSHRTALHYAAEGGNTKVVHFLIESGANVNAVDGEGETPLYFAIVGNQSEVVSALIDAGAEVSQRNNYGATPLHVAAECDTTEIAAILVQNGADVNAVDKNGYTALHWCAWKDSLNTARMLISNGVAVNAMDNKGATPLHVAAEYDAFKIAEILIQNEADVNAVDNEGRTPLHAAAEVGAKDIFDLLSEKGADSNAQNKFGQTPMDVYEEFLKTEPAGDSIAQFADAIDNEDIESMRSMIEAGFDINTVDSDSHRTALHYAAEGGNTKVVHFLIESGANVNAVDEDGYTPLYSAVMGNHPEVVSMLIEAKADVNWKDRAGATPLHVAAECNFYEVAKVLIQRKADVNAVDEDGYTPLYYAAQQDSSKTAEILIVLGGANINAEQKDIGTPLHAAAGIGALNTCIVLVNNGADPTGRDKFGRTPVEMYGKFVNNKANPNTQNESDRIATLLMDLSKLREAPRDSDTADKFSKIQADYIMVEDVHFSPLIEREYTKNVTIKKGEEAQRECILKIVEKGDIAKLAWLVDNCSNSKEILKTNEIAYPHNYLLHMAVQSNNKLMVWYLLLKGVNQNIQNDRRRTPIYLAVENNNLDLVDFFVQRKSNVNISDWETGQTPLHIAVDGGKLDAAKLLLKEAANVNQRDKWGLSPLQYAMILGDEAMSTLLSQHSCRREDLKYANLTDEQRKIVFEMASGYGNVRLMEHMLKNGFDINMKKLHAYRRAIEKEQIKAVQFLIQRGANINNAEAYRHERPIHMAARIGNSDILRELINAGADVNVPMQGGETPLHTAVKYNSSEAAKLLLENGAKVNAKGPSDCTPLHWAVWKNNLELGSLLLSFGADKNAKQSGGITPIGRAMKSKKAWVKLFQVRF